MLLWIRRDFSTRSAVYVRANWLDKDCIEPASMLEKKRLVFSKRVSAHPILWIFSGLSTVEPKTAFIVAHAFNVHVNSRADPASFTPVGGATAARSVTPACSRPPWACCRRPGRSWVAGHPGSTCFVKSNSRSPSKRRQTVSLPSSTAFASSRLPAKPLFGRTGDSVRPGLRGEGGFFHGPRQFSF